VGAWGIFVHRTRCGRVSARTLAGLAAGLGVDLKAAGFGSALAEERPQIEVVEDAGGGGVQVVSAGLDGSVHKLARFGSEATSSVLAQFLSDNVRTLESSGPAGLSPVANVIPHARESAAQTLALSNEMVVLGPGALLDAALPELANWESMRVLCVVPEGSTTASVLVGAQVSVSDETQEEARCQLQRQLLTLQYFGAMLAALGRGVGTRCWLREVDGGPTGVRPEDTAAALRSAVGMLHRAAAKKSRTLRLRFVCREGEGFGWRDLLGLTDERIAPRPGLPVRQPGSLRRAAAAAAGQVPRHRLRPPSLRRCHPGVARHGRSRSTPRQAKGPRRSGSAGGSRVTQRGGSTGAAQHGSGQRDARSPAQAGSGQHAAAEVRAGAVPNGAGNSRAHLHRRISAALRLIEECSVASAVPAQAFVPVAAVRTKENVELL